MVAVNSGHSPTLAPFVTDRVPIHSYSMRPASVRSQTSRFGEGRFSGPTLRNWLSARLLIMAVMMLMVVSLLAGQVVAQQGPQPGDGTVKGQHGDWQIVCKPPPAGSKNEICALVQSVTAEDRNNVGLTVYFQRFSNGTRVLRVFAPLGILLPPGLGLKIDDKDVGNAPFLRCTTFACFAQVVVDDPLVEQLRTGKTAIFVIFQTEEAGIGIPISLSGFAQALAALK